MDIWSHSEPAHWNLFITVREKISVDYICPLICAENKNLTLKSSEDWIFFNKIFTFSESASWFISSFHLHQTHVSLPLYPSFTLNLQVQMEPLKLSGLVRFQIYWRALTGPPQICFSSAGEMRRLLYFLLIACDG